MSAGLQVKPFVSRPFRMVADWRMIFVSLSSNVNISVACAAGIFFSDTSGRSTWSGGFSSGFGFFLLGAAALKDVSSLT